jgi:hypothetical protein
VLFNNLGVSAIFECLQAATVLGASRQGSDVDLADNFIFSGFDELSLTAGVSQLYQLQAFMTAGSSSMTVSRRRLAIERIG